MKTGAQMAEWHASLTPRQSSRGAPLRRCKTCMLQSVVHRNEKAIPGSFDMRVAVSASETTGEAILLSYKIGGTLWQLGNSL